MAGRHRPAAIAASAALAFAAAGGLLAVAVAAAPLPGAAPAPVTEAELEAEVQRLAAAVTAVRKLPVRGKLESHPFKRAEARAQIEGAVTSSVSGSSMAFEERALQLLGLLPPAADYARAVVQALAAAPAGYYDPATRRLFAPDWIPLDRQRAALAHEVAHAAADQRFGLRQTLQIGADGRHRLEGDAERARQALIEGDALVAGLEVTDARGAGTFLGGRALPGLAERLRAAVALPAGPRAAAYPFVQAVSLFTHVDGMLFVGRVRARQPWAAVDAIWADPPQSTAQVLHPEKYDRREGPSRITAGPLLALEPAMHPAGSDVLGELAVRTWLAASLSAEVAERAAAGWAGDRAVLYRADAPPLAPARDDADGGTAPAAPRASLAWLTLWDDVTDADDFARAALVALSALAGEATPPAYDDRAPVVVPAGAGIHAVAIRGNAVALLVAAPPGTDGALAEMLHTWRRAPAAGEPTRKRR